MKHALIVGVIGLVSTGTALSSILVQNLGIVAPPSALGPYTMVSYPDDTRLLGQQVTDVPSPLGYADLQLNKALYHYKIGYGWATWSHGYTGDVYALFDYANGSDLQITLPPNCLAFYLYVAPNLYQAFDFEVKSQASLISTQILLSGVQGNAGANGVGFWTDDPSDQLLTITVREVLGQAQGFAVGEFGINVPEPEIYALVAGLGLVAFGAYRRIRK